MWLTVHSNEKLSKLQIYQTQIKFCSYYSLQLFFFIKSIISLM